MTVEGNKLSVRLAQRPETTTIRISDLLDRAAAGRVRVPAFHRPLRWRAAHVRALFDSVYRGYPIGVLLFSRRRAEAEHVSFGPWSTPALETNDAWYVVDGQQRVAALVGTLLHPRRSPRQGAFAVWFDLEMETFERVTGRDAPPHWIPLNVVSDLSALGEWLDGWSLRRERPDLAKRARSLQKAILDYVVPTCLLGDDDEVARTIFLRINTNGVRTSAGDIFNARYGRGGNSPLDCARWRVQETTRFGLLSSRLYLRVVKAVHGVDAKDAASDLDWEESLERPEVIESAGRALLNAIDCLREDACISDALAMPYRSPPLILLARFFALHPNPSPRTRALLARWVWRAALSGDHATASQGMINAGQRLITDDEHASVEALLHACSIPSSYPDASLPWNTGSAGVRACAAAMLDACSPEDADDTDAEVDDDDRASTAAPDGARFVSLDGQQPGRVAEAFVADQGLAPDLERLDAKMLHAHFVTADALAAWSAGRRDIFYTLREREMTARMARFFRLRCGVGDSDRIAISAIKARVEAAFRP